jgi:hypothetical protein
MKLKRYSGLALGVGTAGFLLMAQSSCSVIVNDFQHQCENNQDCIDLAAKQPLGPNGEKVSGLICSTKEHVCVQNGCRTNKECQDSHDGEPYLCRQSDHTCQSLILASEDPMADNVCDILADPDDIANENTIWIGASVIFAPGSNQGLELVRQDFNKLAQGLPPATATSKARRPLAFVYCEADPTLDEGAEHLINTLQLPVVITSLDTTSEIEVLTKYSLAADPPVFQLSTSAGGALLKAVDNEGMLLDLVLINENYDKETTELVKNYYTPLLQATGGPLEGGSQPRVAIINSGTPTYRSLADKTVTALSALVGKDAKGHENAQKFSYGTDDNPTGDPSAYTDVVNRVLAFKPHVIIVMADEEIGPAVDKDTGEVTSDGVDAPIEKQWAAKVPGQPPPQWLSILGSVGQLPQDMATLAPAAQTDWASRTLFIQQHYDFNGDFFKSYFEQLKALVGDDPNGVLDVEQTSPFNEFLREGAYLTAYSYALLTAQGEPVTGANLAKAARSFGKTTAETPSFPIGRDGIFQSLQSIAKTKKPFDLQNFQGWNGFDENGFAKYTFADDVACVTPGDPDMDGKPTLGALKPTGGIFETTGDLNGTILLDGCVSK